MKQQLKDTLEDYYQEWIMGYTSDEIHCKDDLIDAVESMKYYKEFEQHILKVLRGEE